MSMQESVLYIVLALLCVVIYLLISKRKNKDDDKNNEELNRLKDSLTSSINTMSSSFNTLSKDVTRDMTQALTRVDEKVGVFNKQVEDLNKSQASFSKILAGVKKYGTLAEFSLASILKDLLPVSQYIANVKMKEDTGENVEFAVKLQGGVLVPIDSHWPVEKFQAISDAEEAKDKKAIASGIMPGLNLHRPSYRSNSWKLSLTRTAAASMIWPYETLLEHVSKS